MKKRYKKQAKVAMAVALATTSLANSTGYALAKEETEVNEYNPIDNEKVNGDLVQEKQEALVEEKVTEEVETETLQKVEEASETTENVEEIQNTTQTEGVAINEENFPDAEFRRIVGTTTFDKDQDGVLSSAELNAVTQINVNGNAKIASLKGIEYFKNITRLDAYNMSSLKTLDVSKNTKLQTLYCYNNSKLKGLDVSGNSDLRYLWIKDSSYTGTNLVWLKMGAHPNLRNDSSYYKNYTSTINIGEVGETFNLKEMYPDLDLERVFNMTGADIDLTTGEVSNYQDFDRTQTITYRYRGGTIQNNTAANLTVQLSIETQALPQGKEIIVAQGKDPNPADGIANKDLLKGGATYEWEGDTPDTSEIGTVTGNIIVRYPDGSSHKVENIRINVGVQINAENFPDGELRAHVGSLCDKNQDDILTVAELDAVVEINVGSKANLASLQGIAYFKNLKSLSFNNTKVSSVDFSKNTALTYINANNTPLETLDVSKNIALENLYVSNTPLEIVDVSKNTALTLLHVNNTPLEEVDVSKNTALQTLYAYNMPNLTSINVQGVSALQDLRCYNDPKLKGLDVSGNPDLRNLWIKDSSYTGTDLLWLKMGAHPNLQNKSDYYKNATSSINIGEVGESFNLKDLCPDIDLSRITNVSGADIDLTTGVVSNYQDYDQTQTISYTYRGGTIQSNAATSLRVQLSIGTQALPQGKEIIVAQGKEVDPADGIANKELLKDGATYEWEGGAPDTSEIGIVTGNIIVRYPDDSTHKVENVRVNVGIEINTKNFSDAGFSAYVSNSFDRNQDGILTEAELNSVTQINVNGNKSITTLKGIEYFKKVTRIDAYNSSLESLDVSKNTALITLNVYENPNLTTLNLQGASALQDLRCYRNPKLKGLDVSGNSDLRYLWIKGSGYSGTDLVWLKMGNHPSLRNDTNYYKNDSSTITIGEVGETFNLKNLYPDLDLSRIISVSGADIDLTTGVVSNYQDYDRTQTISYTYRGGTIQSGAAASLRVHLSIETQALPQGKEIIVAQGNEVDPADGIANKDLLNKGATYAWEGDAPDTSEIGIVTGNIIVRYPDGSSHKVENVRVNVGIELSTKNFPDAELSAYIGNSFDKNQDEILTKVELDAVREINVGGKANLANLKGIEYFNNLKTLTFYSTKVSSVDFSKNTALTFINANNTPLETLDVSKNAALETLYVYNTPLKKVDVSKNAALQTLYAYNMPNLTNINVQGASALQTLYCYGNPSLIGLDISGNSGLRDLYIKDSTNPGTNLVWLNMGAHPNLQNNSNYYKNATSTITIGEVGETFNLKKIYPDLDLSRIISVTGADIDLTTGEVSNYQDYDRTQTIYYTYRGGTIQSNASASLRVQLSIETQALPQGKEIIVAQGKEVDPAEGIANKDLLKEGATYEWEGDAPDTSEIGIVTGNIIVRYPDDSTHKVENVRVNVGLEVNLKNFPDAEFRAYISGTADKNKDDVLTEAELNSVTQISVNGKTNLTNLKGIEYFKKVTRLDVYGTSLETLDVSQNTALTTLYAYNTSLKMLDVSKNTALTTLHVYENPNLTTLNLQGASALQDLRCYRNPKLKGLDVSGNSDLRYLWIKDSGYSGTDLVWLNMGVHPNLRNDTNYYKNAPSDITIGEVEETFNLKEIYPDLDLNRIIRVSGGDIDLTTGVVSNYQDYDRTQTISYTYRGGTIQSNTSASLTVRLYIETQALPKGQDILVVQGETPNPADGIANKDLLNEGATYAWEGDAPDTSEIGIVTGNIIVSYPDGSSHKVENVRIDVGIELNTKNFPDGEFRSYVGNTVDKNQDDILSSKELNAVTQINVGGKTNLTNLKGIEYFQNVTRLDAYSTSLETLDVSKNTALTQIYVYNTPLKTIDVSKNTALTTLHVYENPNLTTLNLQGASALQDLRCYRNPKLKGLDVSGNSDLRYLWIKGSGYSGTDLVWLNMGVHSNLRNDTNYYKNDSSTITIGEVGETFNLKELYPDLDLSRIISVSGADIDLTTGEVSNYQDYDRTQTISYTYRGGTIQSGAAASLRVHLSIETQALPQGKEIVIAQGKTPNPADGIANKDLLNEGATYEWEGDAPDTSEIGIVTGNIIVRYPDDSFHKVENVRVNVGVELNTKNFPDGEFRAYVSTTYDKDQDAVLSSTEVDAITQINVGGKTNLTNLKGIEYLKNVTVINAYNTSLETLDVSKNTALTQLNVYNTSLKTIDVSKNTALTTLYVYENPNLTTLNLQGASALQDLRCYRNPSLKGLDVSGNSDLRYLWIKDSGYSGTDLVWLNMGAHPNLRNDSSYFKNATSTITIGEVEETFNLKDIYPDLDLNRITSVTGADIDLTTGEVSNYQDFDKTQTITYRYRSGTVQSNAAASLTVQLSIETQALPQGKEIVIAQGKTPNPADGIANKDLLNEGATYEWEGEAPDTSEIGIVTGNIIVRYPDDSTHKVENVRVNVGVELNTKNFPDGEFRAYVSTTYDKDQDAVLSSTEVDAITQINVSGNTNLTNLKGIEYLKNVTVINAYNTSLETLDVSKNTALTQLNVYNTSLKTIDVSKNTALTTLQAHNNPNLTTLNLQGARALQTLYCYGNPSLKGLDVSGNSDLRNLWIKDSSYTGTDLVWLNMGAHPNLSSSSSYFKNATSTITIGEVEETFNLKDIYPDLDLNRITNVTGADIDLTTGEVSNYQDFDKTQTITYKYRSGTIQSSTSAFLTVQLSIETQALPQGKEIVIAQGKTPNPADGIANKDLLNEGATYEWEGEAPDTSEIGIVTGNIIVRYPDDSFHKVENVRVNVGVELNTKNFPDGEFRAYVSTTYDKDQDAVLSSTEVDAITQINVSGNTNLTNLKGIEYLKNVTVINAYNTSLETLDVSKNTALTQLNVYNTSLKTIDVSKNTALTTLQAYNNPHLTTLNVQGARALQTLYCYGNPSLKGLDVSGNSDLRYLWIKDSSYTGTDLVWLNMGAHPNLSSSSSYFKNATSTITIGEVEETFNLKELYPDLDLNRITSVTGADIDLTTGEVSNYQDFDRTHLITYKYRSGTIQSNSAVSLTVQLSIETQALPQGQEIVVAQGKAPNPADGIANKDLLKEGATYEWEGEAPDTSKVGIVTGNIIVRYPDDSTHKVENVTVNVGVELNTKNFPDGEFRAYIGSTFDKNQDEILTSAELDAVTQINVSGNTSLMNLKGMEYFKNVTRIDAYNTSLQELDASKNTALTTLYLYNTSLETLDVSKNTALTTLHVYNNPNLTTLNLQGASALQDLRCYNDPKLKGLDVSGNPNLNYLWIKDSSYTGTDLLWLKMGAHPNLSSSSSYYKNATSTITIGEVAETFNLKDISSDIELDRITNITGADIDLTTGVVSNYQDYDRTQLITYTYRSGTIQSNSAVSLTVQLSIETQALPQGQEIVVAQGKEANPADGIANKELLKEGATYEWEGDAPDTSEIGIVTGNIIVSYPDNTSHKVENVRVNVGIELNTKNFPDGEFRAYIGSAFDKNQDDILSSTEVDAITQINVNDKTNLTSLQGIEYFKNVTRIDANNTSLEVLDVSKNPALTTLYVYNNPLLTTLNLQGASALQDLRCYNDPKLKGLDVSGNPDLRYLWIKDSGYTGTDLAWLKMGAHSNLSTSTSYFKNATSTITIGEVEETFNLKEMYPEIELDRITNMTGADIDLTTGVVSNYQDYDGTQLITYTYRSGTIQGTKGASLTVQLSIEPDALPQGQEIVVVQGVVPNPADGIANKDLLKEGATYEWEGGAPDTSEVSVVTGNIIVRYPDGSSHKVENVRVNVGIDINEENFPDEEFRTYIESSFDKNKDGVLASTELDVITEINVNNKTNLTSLKGIEHLKNVTHIYANNTSLEVLDVSKNTALTNLNVNNNPNLTTLNVQGASALKVLFCYDNPQLRGLDVSQNTELTNLNVRPSSNKGTNLAWLHVGNNPKLSTISSTSININISSTIDIDTYDKNFNLTEAFPGIDPSKIISINGGTVDKGTGVIVRGDSATVEYAYDSGIKSENGTVVLNVTLTFPIEEVIEYTPKGQDITAFRGEEPNAADGIANKNELPEGTTYAWAETPDTSTEGIVQGTILVMYPDGTTATVDININVIVGNAETYEPKGQNLTVFRGEEPNAADGIANKDDLPQSTRYEWKQKPDTSTEGKVQATIVLTYPDGSSEEVRIVINVLVKDVDKYTPEGKDLTVYRGETPDAAEGIANKGALPGATNYEWKQTPNTSTEGTVQGTIVVAYPDGTSEEVTININVILRDVDKYTPQGQDLTVYRGETPNAADGIANKDALPEGTSYNWEQTPNTSAAGRVQGNIVVTYPDGTSETVQINIDVIISNAETYEPKGQNLTVYRGEAPSAEEGIANKDDLPEGTSYEWKKTPDTSTEGSVQATIVVSYPDGSREEVIITIDVLVKDVDKYTPQGQDIAVYKGEEPNAADGIANKDELPQNTNYSWVETPDTSTVGTVQGTIVVSYPDGTSETVTINVNVVLNDAEKYTPQGQDLTVLKGVVPNAADGIANKDALPQNTNYAWASTPDTSAEGTVQGTIVVSYPDGTSEEVTINIHVTIKDEEKYTPQGQEITVFRGEEPNAADGIANKDALPQNTNYAWASTPDTSEEGTVEGTIVVTYPDGSSEEVTVTINVILKDEEKYTPQGQDLTVFKGETPNAEDGIINKGDLPEGTSYDWKETPNTSAEGTVEGTIVVAYPDGSSEEVTINIHVRVKDEEKYTPQGQDLTVLKGETPNAADGIANKDALPEGTSYDWKETPNTSAEGTVQGTIVVAYPDGTSEEVTINIHVVLNDAEKYTPQGQEITVFRGETPSAEDGIANKGDLPEDTSYEWKETPNTSAEGTVQGTIVVTYPDRSSEEVTINIHVRVKDVDKYTPQGKDLTVFKGETPNAADGIANKDALPEGTSYDWAQTPDTSAEGTVQGTIVVSYPDGTSETVQINIDVVISNAETYEPQGKDLTVFKGETPNAADGIANKDALPEGTSYDWKETPNTSAEGTVEGTIVVSYPDGSREEVTININVVTKNTETYEPQGKDLTVFKGETPNAADGIANKDALPEGTSYDWVQTPDTSTEGRVPGTIVVSYPDGTSETVEINIDVVISNAETYEPQGKDLTVFKGETPNAADGIANKDALPEGTSYDWKETPDTSAEGTVEGTIVVSYPDGSSEEVTVNINVVTKNTETYEPQGKDLTVFKGETPNAEEGIANKDALPEGTSYDWKETPNTSAEGTVEGTIVVSYPDGTSEEVTINIHVRVKDEEKYTPQGKDLTVFKGETPNAEEGIANKDDLPEGTSYDWKETPNTSAEGTVQGTIVVSYPDGTSEEVTININVTIKDEEKYTPQGQDLTVFKGETPNAADGIANKDDLPEGTSYDWKETPNTSAEGTVQGTIVVSYPDGSSEEVTINIHVRVKDEEKYTPQGQDLTVFKGETPNAADGIANKDALPEGTNYEWKETPDTSAEGTVEGTIVVSYPDGTSEEVTININVAVKDEEKYTPQGQDLTVVKGEEPNAADGIANKDALPEGTSYDWKETPDTSSKGTVQGTIVVNYPDGTSEEVTINIHVVENDAEKYAPQGQDLTVVKGETPNAADGIANKDALPEGTSYDWKETPDTSAEGTVEGIIVVSYPDGSGEEVTINIQVVVKDADKYTPQGKDLTVYKGETPNAADGIVNKDALPEGTSYDWKETPDTSAEGTVEGTIVVSYPDGSSEEVTINIHVRVKDEEKYTPQGQDLTVVKGETPNAADGIANKDDLPEGTNYDWKETPDTSAEGTVEGTIVVSYPDGSSEEVTINIHVRVKDEEKYTPQGQDLTVFKGETPNAADGIANKDALPEGTNYDWKETPDTSAEGTVQGTIVVSYPDGSSEEVTININVTIKDEEKYTPQGQDLTVVKGETPNAADGIANKDDLPEGTSYDWKETPDTSAEGTVEGTIVVSYPDGSSEEVTININVVLSDAEKYTPIVDNNKEINKGETPKAEDFIVNKDELPNGTQYEWVEEPDTSVEGTTTGVLKVTYPDGTSDICDVTMNVVSKEETSPEQGWITIEGTLDKTYDGQAVLEPTVKKPEGSGEVTFEWYTADGIKLDKAPVDAGSYKVKVILEANENYTGAEVEIEFEIYKATTSVSIIGELSKEYDGKPVETPKVKVVGSTGQVSYEWYRKEETAARAITWTRLEEAPVEIGSYKLVVRVAGDRNYEGAMAEKEFTISKVGENTPDNPVVVPTPPTGGIITNPDGGEIIVKPGDNIESNGPVVENPDGSITFPNGGTVTKPDGSTEEIQPGGTLKPNDPVVVPTPPTGGTITNPDGTPGPEVNPGDNIESNGPVVENPDGSITFPEGGTITKPDGSEEVIQPGGTLKPNEPEVVPTPPTGGTITNPDGTPGPEINPGDDIESNGPVVENPDGSITFPNGGTITKPDGSVEIIQPGATLRPNGKEEIVQPGESINGVQTGDKTQVGLWSILAGLSTGMMMFFRRKRKKEE